MYHYIFASTNIATATAAQSLEALDESSDRLFEVVLANQNQFKILLTLLEIHEGVIKTPLAQSEDFDILYDYSTILLPEMTTGEFEQFYQDWIEQSARDNDMDEYGQLLFLQGQASQWNKRKFRFILRTKT